MIFRVELGGTKAAEHRGLLSESGGVSLHEDELESLLQRMKTSGTADSWGVFTISWNQAREKLSQFALPDPHRYVLNLVASAVAGGARNLRVDQTSTELTFFFDGRVFGDSELREIWNHLLQPRDRGLEELAVALIAVRARSEATISVETWSGEAGCRLRVGKEQLQVDSLRECPWPSGTPGSRVRVREPIMLHNVIRWARGFAEQKLLSEYARQGPARLYLQGKNVSKVVSCGLSPQTVAWRYLRHRALGLPFEAPDPKGSPYCLRDKRDSEGDYSAVLCVGPPQSCQKEGMSIILNGVTFTLPTSILGYSILSGAVAVGYLRKNVSHTELAQDQAFEQLLASLRREGENLIIDRLRHTRPLPEELVEPLSATVPELAAVFRSRGQERQAVSAERWLKEVRYSRNLQDRTLWHELLRDLIQLPLESEEAKALQKRLNRTLRGAARERFFAGRVGETAILWERLRELAQARRTAWEDEDTRVVLRCLAGSTDIATPLQRATDAAVLARYLGRPREALALTEESLALTYAYLALWDFEKAESLLRELLHREVELKAAEALSDLLAFAPPKGPQRRREALRWKEIAVELREAEWPEAQSFFLPDLTRLAGSAGDLRRRLRYGARLTGSLPPEVTELAHELEAGRLLNLKGQPGEVNIKSALLAAERKWPPGHPILSAARARGVHLLRSAQLWAEADDILARNTLLASVGQRISGAD